VKRSGWLLLVLALAALGPVACSLGLPVSEPAVSLEDSSWTLDSYANAAGQPVSALPGTEITLSFVGDEIRGQAGCNWYFVFGEVEGDRLTVSSIDRTAKYCAEPEGIMQQEDSYVEALESVTAYRIQGNRLNLLDEKGAVVADYHLSSSAPVRTD
jgi:heat shock protein HslJ